MKKKIVKKLKKKKNEEKLKSNATESVEFGSITVLKAGSSLAALLISQSANGMSPTVY